MNDVRALAPAEVQDRLRRPWSGSEEWAFLDLRPAPEAAEAHPFGSANPPFEDLDHIAALIPRPATPLIILDGRDGVAERTAARLAAEGRSDIAVVEGGVPGWQAAGLLSLEGEHTWSKTFGEWVHEAFAVPEIGPEGLRERMSMPDAPLLVDGRPVEQHRAFTLPGARSCSNAELALRLPAMADVGTPLVVHCAGRTRSIIGAQTVRDFNLPYPVAALRNGTQGWALAGLEREEGADPSPPNGLATEGLVAVKAQVNATLARHAIPTLNAGTLDEWRRDEARTTYFRDPRPDGEDVPPPGCRRVPGTTLVQETLRTLAVRGARVVLWDPLPVRAAFAAIRLRRMGLDAHVLTEPPRDPPSGEPRLTSRPRWAGAARAFAGRHHGVLSDARACLDWEAGLVPRLRAAGLLPWPAALTTLAKP